MTPKIDVAFSTLITATATRSARWHNPDTPWSLSDYAVALAGETGEVCNVIKKLNRARDGMRGNAQSEEELRSDLALELADTLAYLILLAHAANIDLVSAYATKYNEVSVRVGFSDRILPDDHQDVFVYLPNGAQS